MTTSTTADVHEAETKLDEEANAIDAVLEEMKNRCNKHYYIVVRQVGHRLQKFLKEKNIGINEMIADNLGQTEIMGEAKSPRARALYQDALRAILRGLCERGITALDFGRCLLPAFDMNPHRDPRGLIGYPESVLGIYPEWLVPTRFMKAIRANAAMPEKIRAEFRRFAEAEKNEINERTLGCYLGNIQVLVNGTGIQSLMELHGPAGVARLARFIDGKHYTMRTSTVSHWRRVLRFFMGKRNPLDLRDEFDNYILKLPKRGKKPVIKEGATFIQDEVRMTVVGGIIQEPRISIADLKRLLATPIKSKDFRSRQEDVLVRFLALIKDRPAETWARNHGSWTLHDPIEGNEQSKLFAGDGVIRNNFRTSIKKSRPDKPFPRWLAERLRELWPIRREHFRARGDCDLRVRPSQGLIDAGVPLWCDPRTGQRASQGQLREWARNGLLRAGMKLYVVARITGYWFRRGVITGETFQGAMFEALCETSGHTPRVALRDYVGRKEMAYKVALERLAYWIPMGISGNARKELVPVLAKPADAVVAAPASQAALGAPEEGLLKGPAAKRLGKSVHTLRRWAKAGLIGTVGSNGSTLFSARDIDALRVGYMTPREIADARRLSEGNIRRLCREGKIPGVRRVGRKTYLIPVAEAMRLG